MFSPDVAALVRHLDEYSRALARVTDALIAQREAFLVLRPSDLEGAALTLHEQRSTTDELERRRQELTDAIALRAGVDGDPTARELAVRLNDRDADALLAATAATARAATRLRVEGEAARRVLATSRRAHDAFARDLLALGDSANGYDNHGRTRTDGDPRGRLVSGRA